MGRADYVQPVVASLQFSEVIPALSGPGGMKSQTVAQMQVPFFRYAHLFHQQRDEVLTAMVDVMERGAYILQADLEEFEQALARHLGVAQVIGVANGTDALIIALRAVGVGTGDEVILPSHTYVATAASVHFVGARPVLVECGEDHLMDPAAVEAAVTPRSKAIMPVQLNGRTCEMEVLQSVADRHGLVIVEDAAQGLGSKYKGRAAGSFGIAAAFSFYPAKLLGCFGDGGAVATSNPETARRVALLRDHGRDAQGEVVTWGLNSRLDNLQAAVLHVKLKAFEREVERRRDIARLYRQGLEEIDDLGLPPGPDHDPDHYDVYQNYEIESGRREALRAYLQERGIRTVIQWAGKPVHQFTSLGLTGFKLPRTDRLFERCFLLPMNTSLTDAEVRYVAATIRGFYGLPD